MKRIISYAIINLVFGSLLVTAQTESAPNFIDSLGLKQGLWIELEAKPDIVGVMHYDLLDGTSTDRMKYDLEKYIVLKYFGSYENGLRTGEWNVYSPDGTIRYSLSYCKGVLYGPFTKYYFTGGIESKGFIKRAPFTEVSRYNEDGSFIKIENWFTSGLIERLNR